MASLIKIKRSNVAAKRPTTSDIAAGELALNTKDKRAFSSDGGVVFEIGANVHSLSVGSGAFSIANGAITFPTSDGSVGQVLSTDGSGTLSFSSISSSGEVSNAYLSSTYTTNTVFQSALANTNSYIATKVSTSTFNSALANTNSYIAAVETREAAHTANTLLHLANTNSYIATKVSTSTFNSALANTNSYIATKVSTSTFNSALANTNSYIAAVETREAAHTANTLLHLANTNSYIATKVSTSTFNSALSNTNSYIATVQSDVDSNEATERAALANTNSYIATKVSTSTFNSALANTNSYIATKVSTSTFNSALANTNSYIATVQSDVDSNEATERAALANTNSYIATKANIASPTFTGVPAAPTASAGTNTTQIATTAFVRTEVTNLIDSAPTTLDTLNELAAALGDDPNFATTIASTYQTKSVERAALANTNSYIATKVSTSTFNSALANTNSYIATKLSSSSYTAADVLSKLLTVDGAGTGLDADTVDGIQGSSIVTSTTITNHSLNPKFATTIGFGNDTEILKFNDGTNETRSGYWSSKDGFYIQGDSNSVNNVVLKTGNLDINQNAYIVGQLGVGSTVTAADILPPTDNTGTVGNASFTWNNGQFTNLTIDSTLNVRAAIDLADSDVLRLGSSDDWEFFHNGTDNYMDLNVGNLIIRDNTTTRFTFARTTGNLTATGTVQGTQLISTVATGTAPLTVSSTTLVTNLNADLFDGVHRPVNFGASFGGSSYITNANLDTNYNVLGASVFYPAGGGSITGDPTDNHSGNGYLLTFGVGDNANRGAQITASSGGNQEFYFRTRSDAGWASWNKMWHTGNDGSGSGLDADLLDGVQGSSFLRSDANDSFSGAITGTGSISITGAISATTKSFVIDHPTKEGMKLRYGSLEGPENGVYVRGRLKDNNVIELPDYWTGLVDEDTITVNLTAIGKSQNLYVADIKDNKVYVKGSRQINCFYTVFGERKDVDKLEVEYESE